MYDYKRLDIAVYNLAKEFLLNLGIPEIDQPLLEEYCRISINCSRPNRWDTVFMQFLESAQSHQSSPKVIGNSIGGVKNLASILENFEPLRICLKFSGVDAPNDLLDEIKAKLNPKGEFRRTPKSLWPRYVKTILSGAQFFSSFNTVLDFFSFCDAFNSSQITRPALPMVLEHRIYGIGFALACDFLKEIGYLEFGKPDVHIREIFTSIGLAHQVADDLAILEAVQRVAEHVKVSPFAVDRVFWLIASGNFFKDSERIGNQGRIGSQKRQFIQYVHARLDLKSFRITDLE